jgi:hypothetical protein
MEYGGFPSSMKSADLPHSQIFTILRYLKHPNNFPRFSPCFLHVFPCVSQFFSQVPPKNLHTAGWPPAVPRHVRGRCWRQPTATWRRSVCSCWWSCRSDTCGSQWMAFRGSKGLVDHWNFCMHMMGIYIIIYISLSLYVVYNLYPLYYKYIYIYIYIYVRYNCTHLWYHNCCMIWYP